MSRRWTVRAVVLATAALLVAVLLAGAGRGVALYVYVLVLGATGLLLVTRRLIRGMPVTHPITTRSGLTPHHDDEIGQLEAIRRSLAAAEGNAVAVHRRLRPLTVELAEARLMRRHGVDLQRQPQRARALVGHRTWELVRPDRAQDESGRRGWPRAEMRALIDELEAI